MKNIFCWKSLENNNECLPFGLFIANINLLLLFSLLSLAVLGFILNKLSPFQRYEVPTMLLEKVSIHTESPFVH